MQIVITYSYSMKNGMANDDDHGGLSPTVLHVMGQFAAAMRADDEVEGHAIDRLEKLLRKGAVPKPDEINTALFDSPPDGDT